MSSKKRSLVGVAGCIALLVPAGGTAVAAAAPNLVVRSLAYDHNGVCALMGNGSVYCWGANAFGQLGSGSSAATSDVPVMVRGLNRVTSVVGNTGGYCAIEQGGAVYCWGYNNGEYGTDDLGDGNTTAVFSAVPVRVKGLSGALNLVSVSSGYDIAEGYCAQLSSGYVKCWGSQSDQMGGGLYASGLLGDGGTGTSSPVPVTAKGINNAVGLAGGQSGYCAVLRNTKVECWGDNQYDELGDGHLGSLVGSSGAQQSSAVPVPVVGLLNATSVVSYAYGYCALLTTGKVRCWGNDSFGELGDGAKANAAANYGSDAPVPVVGLGGVARLVGSPYTVCALLTGGKVKCWGYNDDDALGDGESGTSQSYSDVPQTVVGVAKAISLGANLNSDFCAVLASRITKCWGNNGFGELGSGNDVLSAVATPVTVRDLSGAVKIGSGFNGGFNCAVLSNGGAECWGWNASGELGAGPAGASLAQSDTPLKVLGLGS